MDIEVMVKEEFVDSFRILSSHPRKFIHLYLDQLSPQYYTPQDGNIDANIPAARINVAAVRMDFQTAKELSERIINTISKYENEI